MKLTIDLNNRDEMLEGYSLLESRIHAGNAATDFVNEASGDIDIEKRLDDGDTVGKTDTTTGEAELDADNIPWDARIHSSSHKKTQKDVWKLARGVDKNLVATVLGELKAGNVAKIVTAVTDTPPPPPAALNPDDEYISQGVTYTVEHLRAGGWEDDQIMQLDKKPSLASAPPPPPASTATDTTFPQLLQRITAAIAAEELTDADVTAVFNAEGLQSKALLAARPDLIPVIESALFG